jgi:hypothetical protein
METVIAWCKPKEVTHLSVMSDKCFSIFETFFLFFTNNCSIMGDKNHHRVSFIDGVLVYRREISGYTKIPKSTCLILMTTRLTPKIQLGTCKKLYILSTTKISNKNTSYKHRIVRNTYLNKIYIQNNELIFQLNNI